MIVFIHILENVVAPLHNRKKVNQFLCLITMQLRCMGGGLVYLHTFLNLTTDIFIYSSMVYLKMLAAVETIQC